MKILLRNKEKNSKMFLEAKKIILTDRGNNSRVSVICYDEKTMTIDRVSSERLAEIEMKICQDYVIDLTDDFENFQKTIDTEIIEESKKFLPDVMEMLEDSKRRK